MPNKLIFDTDDGITQLTNILNKINQALAGVNKVKTVEELQTFIDNLNRIAGDIRLTIASN